MKHDPFDLLRAHVRRHADTLEPGTSTDELVSHITLEHHRAPFAPAAPPPRRWGSVAVGIALSVGVGTGAVVTSAMLDQSPVEQPQAGMVCRPSVDDLGSGIEFPLVDDPIRVCTTLWSSGELPIIGGTSPNTTPALVACVGQRATIEVFPGSGPQVCDALGMALADIETAQRDPRVELNLRIAAEINAPCLPPGDARQAAAALLDELGFEEWQVVLRDGVGCGLVAFGDGNSRVLFVNPTPPPR